jgi:hypothetical protein
MSDERTMFLLSFLMILIERNGGTLTIENLSKYRGKNFRLTMDLQPGANRVVLTTEKENDKMHPPEPVETCSGCEKSFNTATHEWGQCGRCGEFVCGEKCLAAHVCQERKES